MKKWMKAFVAIVALVAMLMENTYSVYATMDGYTSPEATADMQVIEVNTAEEADSANEVEDTVADLESETTETVAEDENIETDADTGIEDAGALLASEDIEESEETAEIVEAAEAEDEETTVGKSLDYKGGKIIGEGYNNLRLAIDASELPDDVYYVLNIDTEATVEYDGNSLEDNKIKAIPNKVTDIYLSNLNNSPFELYILGENSDEIGAEYYIESVENGAIRMSINMNGSNIEEDKEIEETEEENQFISISAVFVDEFGDEIIGDYEKPELSFDNDGVMVLDDVENPPFDNFEIDLGSGKLVKYVYQEAKIDGNVISSLRQQELTVDGYDEEAEEDISETGFVYDYTVNGSDWEKLTEDTVVQLVYSDGKKTTYEYEDDDIFVTATLQHANAIPDDAEFIVTPITSESSGYNYDAYMEALNENAEAILGEDGAIDDDNTLIYDIGFFITDEEGNLIEIQPQDGSVSIKVRFKNEQLENDINSGAENELSVVHLPLSDEVKEEYATTEEATDISADDIKVEVLSETIKAESETAEFTASEFSPYAFVGKDGKMKPGTNRNFQNILGNSSAYGIVANSMHIAGHLESNFATGYLSGGKNVQTCRNSGGGAGVTYIGEYQAGGGFFMDANGNNTNAIIFTTQAAINNMDGSMKQGRQGVTIDTKTYTAAQIKAKVKGLVDETAANSAAAFNESSYKFSDVAKKNSEGKMVIDLTTQGSGAGTYYIQFESGEYAKYRADDIKIVMNSDQSIVFNIPDKTVSFKRYQITIKGTKFSNYYPQANADEDDICQRVIFNCPNATTAETSGAPCAGVFVVPNSTFSCNCVSAGWVVANTIATIGGQEWHCVFHNIPSYEPVELQFYAKKFVDGNTPGSMEKFSFELKYMDDWNSKHYTTIQTKQNNGSNVTFDKISFNKPGTYIYRISEIDAGDSRYTYDFLQYQIHVFVELDGFKHKITKIDVYKDDKTKPSNNLEWISNSLDAVTFNNLKPLTYEFEVEKLFGDWKFGQANSFVAGEEGWPDGVSFDFILRPFDGGGNTQGVTDPAIAPMPSGTQGSGRNRYKQITLTKENPTGSFGLINIAPNQGFYMNEWVNGKHKVNCQILMYTIEEVVPENKPVGVTYTSHPIRYIKFFVDTYQESDGSYSVIVTDRESQVNNNAVEECVPHIPGPYQFVNKYNPASLIVKKVVKDKNGTEISNNDNFYVAVYSVDKSGTKTYYGTDGKKYTGVHVETVKASSELQFKPLPQGITYYVYETDANGKKVETGRSFEYKVNYDGLGSANDVIVNNKNTVTITNTPLERGTFTLVKKGGNGNDAVNLEGVTFVLKEDDGKYNGEGTRVYVNKEADGTYSYTTDTTKLQELVTDANGKITVSNLPIGNYYLKEVSLPDKYAKGFVQYNGQIKFKVNEDGQTILTSSENDSVKKSSGSGVELSLTVYNKRVPAAIVIKKSLVDAKGGAIDKNRTLNGFKFNLYDTTNGGKTWKKDVTSDEEGKASFAGMLEYGHSYVIEEDAESAAAKGTTLVSLIPSSFTIDDSWYTDAATTTIGSVLYVTKDEIVTNTPVSGKVRLIKQDSNKATITEGSAWFVLSTSNNFENTSSYVKVSGSNGAYKYDASTTNTKLETVNGELTVDELAPGTYYFFETKSPDENKYTYTSGVPFSFTINAKDGTSSQPVIDLTSDEKAVKVPNDTFKASLSFTKVNAFDTNKKLSKDTEFTLYETSTLGGSITGEAVLSVNAANGTVSVPFAKAANYVLVETKTENGYSANYGGDVLKIYFAVTPEQAGNTNLTLKDVNAYTVKDGRTLKASELVDKDNNLVKNEPKTGKVTLIKRFKNSKGQDSDKYIGEAAFTLYTNSVEFKTIKNKATNVINNPEEYIEYGSYTTSNQTLLIENLPWGQYYFVETATVSQNGKDVYDFDSDEKYAFTIGEGADGSLVLDASKFTTSSGNLVEYVENTIKTGSVKITKQDLDTKEGIEGIVFELYTADNKLVEKNGNGGKYTTGNDGSLTVTDLEFGSYYFKESSQQTVKGYTFDTTTKYNFTITGESKPVTELTYVISENGNNVNKTSPNGIITNAPIKGNVTLEKWAIVKGTKANPDYIARLEGAEFTLYSDNASTLGQQILSIFNDEGKYYVYKAGGNGKYTTDNNGMLSVHDLPWGSYYFVETKAPEGYASVDDIPVSDRTYRFVIKEDNLDVFIGRTMNGKVNNELSGKVPVNERLNGSVWLTKKDSETQKGIEGVTFRLFKDGVDYTSALSTANTSDLKAGLLYTDANGQIHVHDLPFGSYKFVEEKALEGYRIIQSESDQIIINAQKVSEGTVYDENNTATMFNEPIKGDLFLEKVNDSGAPLTGATFDLVRIVNKGAADAAYYKVTVKSNGNGNYEYVGLETKDYRNGASIGEKIAAFVSSIFSGNAQPGSLSTSDKGTLHVTKLPYGDYEIYEITTPDGYEPNEDTIVRSFKIDGEKAENEQYDASVKFINSKVFAGVQFLKTAGNNELNGATFVLEKFDSANGYVPYSGGETTSKKDVYYAADDPDNTEIGEYDGVVSFNGLPVGQYRIYETSKSNYSDEDGNTHPYLDNNGNQIWSAPNADTIYYEFTITMSDTGKKNVGLDNFDGNVFKGSSIQTVNNKEREGKAQLLKTDGTSELSGAKFDLYVGTKDKNGYVLGKPSEDALVDTIEASYGIVLTKALSWGDYYLVEKEAKDSTYFLEKNIDERTQFHFTIGPDENGKFNELVKTFTTLRKSDKTATSGITTAVNNKFYGEAEFTKKDAETGKLIESSDVQFELYYKASENGVYQKLAGYSGTNALKATDGKIKTKKDLEAGWYYFVETKTAEGYEELPEELEDRTKYFFTITQGDELDDFVITWGGDMKSDKDGYYVENTPKHGSIELYKFYVLDGENNNLSGATFKLVGKNEKGEKVERTESSTAEGKVLFANLPWGTYDIEEITPPAGYKLPEGYVLPKNIVINAKKLNYSYDETETLKVENERKPGKLKLKKVDDKGKTVPGVKFELQRREDTKWVKVNNPDTTDGLFVTGEGGFLSFFNLREKKGAATIENLEWGQYRLVEREVPEGYQMLEGFIPSEDGVYVGAESMKDESHLEYDLGEIKNSNVHGNIGIKKTDNNGKGLEGAEFKLYQASENNHQARLVYVVKSQDGVYAYVSMDAAKAAETSGYTDTMVSPAGGKIKVTGLPCGTYYMQETKEPNPGTDENGNTIIYQKNSDLIGPFVVDKDQTADEAEQASNSLTWENGSGEFKAEVLFYKTDAKEAGLDGVVYTVKNLTTGAIRLVESKEENGVHGVVRISFTAMGEYSIQEKSTPNDAYEVDPNEYKISILSTDDTKCINLSDKISVPSDGTSRFNASKNTFLNDEATGGVKLVKTESESSGNSINSLGGLNGVSFKLYKVNNSNRVPVMNGNSDIFETANYLGEDGVIYVTNLEWGDYVFVENVPATHTAVKNEYTFTIDANTFKNIQKIETVPADNTRKPGSIKLQKFFENPEPDFDGTGVEFTVTLVEGTSDVVNTFTSSRSTVKDENGDYFVEFTGLPWGIYTLSEGAPADGYLPYKETKTIKIGKAKNSEGYTGSIDYEGIDVELIGNKGITNNKIKGSVKFQKLDSIKLTPMGDVAFKLYKGTHPETENVEVTGKDPIVIPNFTDANGVIKTDKDGYVTFPEKSLEYGSYYLTEAVPEGYEGSQKASDDGKLVFTYRGIYFDITSEATVLLTKSNDKAIVNKPILGRVSLKKVDNTKDHKPLKGVEFTLYADDAQGATAIDLVKNAIVKLGKKITFQDTENGIPYCRALTDENGEIEIEGLPWGTYHFVEKVPTGYTLTDAEKAKIEKPFVIGESNGNVSLEYKLGTITNNREDGFVELVKKGRDDVTGKTILLPGAKFSLYKINGDMDNLSGALANGDDKDTLIATGLETSNSEGDSYGKIVYGPVEWGQYYFVEDEAPFGYDKSTETPKILTVGRLTEKGENYTDITVEPSADFLRPATTVTNTKGYGYTALYKVFDKIGEGDVNTSVEMTDINGVKTYLTFSVYAVDNDGNVIGSPIEIDVNGTKVTEWKVNPGTMMTDIIGPLPYGKYAFVEKSVPSGVDYEISPVAKIFEIDNMSTKANVEAEMLKANANYSFKYVTKFVNTTFRGWANINKIDGVSKDVVEGIVFDVYEVSEDNGIITLGTKADSVVTKEDGVATASELALGKYAFIENESSAKDKGYIAKGEAYVFEITEDTVKNNARPIVKVATKNEDGTYTVTGTSDVSAVENDRFSGSIKLTKKGKDGKKLAGATFNLYKVVGTVDVTPGVKSGNDDADELISAPIETEEGTVTTTDFVTDTNGEIYIKDLAWGTYYFDEINPPKGYKLIKEKPNHTPVAIDGSNVLKTVEVELDNETVKLDISKTDITGKIELEGAEFAIYEKDSDVALYNWTSDGTTKRIEIGDDFAGLKVSLDAENPVVYELKELTPPDGYTAVGSVYFSVDAAGKVTLYDADMNVVSVNNAEDVPKITIKDARTEIEIAKRELGTERYLAGATLKVYDAANYKLYKAGDNSAVSVAEWTTAASDNGSHTLSGKLKVSDETTTYKYYLVETGVPDGYYKAEDVEFYITNENKIVAASNESSALANDNKMLVMYDRPIYVSVTKKETTGNTNLSGAVLSIYDAAKKVNKTFTTTTKPTLLVPVTQDEALVAKAKYEELAKTYDLVYGAKFVAGTEYTLHENSAPDGYKLAADQKFTVDMQKGDYNKALGIYETEMLDDTIKIYISKVDMTGEKELANASLEIYEVNEEENRGNRVAFWTSSNEAHLVSINEKKADEGVLVRGKKYVLVENFAPAGYAVANEITFNVNEDGSITTEDYVVVNEEKIPKLSLTDEPLALCVTKVNAEGTKLEGAKLRLQDSLSEGAKVYAEWESDGKIAFISEYGTCDKLGYTTVKLNSGCHLVDGKKYYIVEVTPPVGYKTADPVEVTLKKYSECMKDSAVIKVIDARFGETSIGGTKTWKLSDELKTQLDNEKKSIIINLYRYYEADGVKNYVGANNEIAEKENAIVASKSINPANSKVSYLFDKLEKYYYAQNGKAYEYKYEVEEDLNGLEGLLLSTRKGNDFINYQKYIDISGDKRWILLKDENGKIIDISDDESLRDTIFALKKDSKSAYVETNIILATIDESGNVTMLDADKDGKADYYITLKNGIKNGESDVEIHDIDASNGTDHIDIVWSKAGDAHFTFKNLPMYDTETGKEIKYAFIENPVDSEEKGAYRVIYGNDDKTLYGWDGVTITNEPVIDPFNISGKKTWKDPFDDSITNRPEVTIQLYRDGQPMPGYSKTLTAADNYSFEFKGLYEYDLDNTKDGHKYSYEIKEEGATGDYSIDINFNGAIERLASDGVRNKTVSITNTIKPEKISISGTKTWNLEYNKNIPTVTFYLYKKDNTTGKETAIKKYVLTNALGNTYKFTNLDKYDEEGRLITYRVEEDMTDLGGFVSTPEAGYIVVPNAVRGADTDITGKDFVNTPSLIRVRKVEEDSERALAGAKLVVKDADGKTVDSWTTSSTDHYIEGLTFGESYTLEETEAPKGYAKAKSMKFTVGKNSIKDGNVMELVMEDPKIDGKVSLTKRDSTTREVLSGATFNLYTSSGSLIHVTGSAGTYSYTDDTTKGTSLSVSSAGALTVDKLPYGSYYFKETSAPKGYKLSSKTESFTIYDSGATVDVTFYNEPSTGSAYLKKTTTDGRTTLAGAVFELYSATPRTAGQAAASTIYSDAYYRYGSYTTGADGMIHVEGLPWDDYYFIEVKAPTGYVTNNDVNGDPLVYPFTIDSSSATAIGVDVGTITNDTPGTPPPTTGGGGGGVAGVRRSGGVISDVLGVRAKPTSGVLGARVGPVTGDVANIALWLLLLLSSISIIVVICIQNHKRKNASK